MGKQKISHGRATVLAVGDIWTVQIAHAIIEIERGGDPEGRIVLRSTHTIYHCGVQKQLGPFKSPLPGQKPLPIEKP